MNSLEDFGLSGLPKDWQIQKILNTVQETDNLNPTIHWKDEEFIYIDVSSVSNDLYKIVNPNRLLGKNAPSRARKRIFKEDVIFATVRPTLKRISRVSELYDGQICSTGFCVLRPKDKLTTDFLYYWLLTDNINQYVRSLERGANYPAIRDSDIKSALMPLPYEEEQKKIAVILSTIQQAIELQDSLIDTTQELKKALMQKLFTEGLRGEPQKQTEIGLVPESWIRYRLDQTGDVVYGIQASVANNFDPIGTKILTNKNITLEGDFDLSTVNYFELTTKRHKLTILEKGDLLFNWRSGSKHHIGKTAYFDMDGEWTHSSFILRIRTNEKENNRFMYYFLNWLRETGYFIKLQTFAVNAKFNKSAVSALPVYLPEPSEQLQISVAIDQVTEKLKHHKQKKQLLTELFNTMLHKLMTAEIRVNELDLSELEQQLAT